MKILGIETSCDECAAAVVEDGERVLSDVVSSQVEIHARYGGVVPEIASRRHLETILPVIHEALNGAGLDMDGVDAVAVTNRPGLIGALLVGLSAAKGLALAKDKPLIPIHHIEAHLYAAIMNRPTPNFPVVGLVVSGGHTSLYLLHSPIEMETLGATLDDAAGEAFDKVASLLGLGYPGGPAIEKAAADRAEGSIPFPRSFPGGEGLDFSFSGIKTAVRYHILGTPGGSGKEGKGRRRKQRTEMPAFDPGNTEDLADVAASFQAAVVDVLVKRTFQAANRHSVKTVLVGGGVAANSLLRKKLEEEAERQGLTLYLTPPRLATDNAVMVAGFGYPLFIAGRTADLDIDAHPR